MSDLDSEIAKILNVGYRAGGAVLRADKFEQGWEPRAYEVYGPKVITHRRSFGDDATQSRCITYKVPKIYELPSHIPSQILPGLNNPFQKEASIIRSKCLKWRFDNIRSIKPDLDSSNKVVNRYREISIPMMTIIPNDSLKKLFIEFMGDTSVSVKHDSDNALCVKAIEKLYSKEKGLKLSIEIQEIAQVMTKLDENEKQWSSKLTGALVTLLGLDANRGGKSGRYRLTPSEKNEKQLEKLFHEYQNSDVQE